MKRCNEGFCPERISLSDRVCEIFQLEEVVFPNDRIADGSGAKCCWVRHVEEQLNPVRVLADTAKSRSVPTGSKG